MATGDDYREPVATYKDEDKRADAYVYIGLDIKGLKKNFSGTAAANAEVKLDLDGKDGGSSTTMTVTVVMTSGSTKGTKYRYVIKRLPAPVLVDPKKSYFRVRKDNVDIYLNKASPGRWAAILSSVGLEQEL